MLGNVPMILLNAIAAVRDHGWRLMWFAALNPLYWVLLPPLVSAPAPAAA